MKKREEPLDESKENLEHYEGEILKEPNSINVNYVYVDLKQSIPNYYAKNPKIFFDPEKPTAEKAAELKQIAVNNRWGKLKMKKKMRDSIKYTKLDGVVGFKTYFNFNEQFTKDKWDDSIFNDEVRTDLVPLKNLLKDSSADSYWSSDWIGHEIKAPINDIAKKFKIKADDKVRITVKSRAYDDDDGDEYGPQDETPENQYGCYYEIENRRAGEVFYIVDGLEKIYNRKKRFVPYDSMYDFLMYNDVPHCADPHSDYYFWKDQLLETAIYRTMMARHAKRGVSKYKSIGEKLSPEQISQLTSAKDTSVVQLNTGQDVQPMQHASLDQSIFQSLQLAGQDIQLISKQAPRQSDQEKTATEVKAVEAANQEVTSEGLERLEEVMAAIANKWALLMEENYTTSRVITLTEMSEAQFMGYKNKFSDKVSGDEKRAYIEFTNEDLKGECTAGVRAGSTLPDNDQSRINKLMGFTKFAGSFPGLAAGIDVEQLLDEAVQTFDVRNENITIRKDNPMEESRLLNSGVFVSARLSEDHDKHLSVHERESNNNESNIIHILEHKQFRKQIEANKQATMQSQLAKMQQQPSGQSFMNMGGNNMPPASPLPTNPMGPMPNLATAPVQGGGLPQ